MKYFKFAQISTETGISWMIAQPTSGPSYPDLPGLTNIIQLNQDRLFYVGEVDNSAVADPDNYIFELTAEEYAQVLKNHVEFEKRERLFKIYEEEKEFRQSIFGKYDESASLAGIYKYEEAKELVADATAAAPQVRQEATFRNVDPVALANRIITNHEDFRTKEATIAGIRGLIYDRLTNFEFDLEDAVASYTDFYSLEKLGERTEQRMVNGEFTDTLVDVKAGKYELSIAARFKFAG